MVLIVSELSLSAKDTIFWQESKRNSIKTGPIAVLLAHSHRCCRDLGANRVPYLERDQHQDPQQERRGRGDSRHSVVRGWDGNSDSHTGWRGTGGSLFIQRIKQLFICRRRGAAGSGSCPAPLGADRTRALPRREGRGLRSVVPEISFGQSSNPHPSVPRVWNQSSSISYGTFHTNFGGSLSDLPPPPREGGESRQESCPWCYGLSVANSEFITSVRKYGQTAQEHFHRKC